MVTCTPRFAVIVVTLLAGIQTATGQSTRSTLTSASVSTLNITCISIDGQNSCQTCIGPQCYNRTYQGIYQQEGCPTVVCDEQCNGFVLAEDNCPKCRCNGFSTGKPCTSTNQCPSPGVCQNFACVYPALPPDLPLIQNDAFGAGNFLNFANLANGINTSGQSPSFSSFLPSTPFFYGMQQLSSPQYWLQNMFNAYMNMLPFFNVPPPGLPQLACNMTSDCSSGAACVNGICTPIDSGSSPNDQVDALSISQT